MNKILIVASIVSVIVLIYIIFKDKIDRMVKKDILNNNTNIPDNEPLLFSEKVTKEFTDKVREIAIDLDINPNSLMYWMNFESAGTFRSDIVNSIGATGLIQFTPLTAIDLGTTTTELAKLTNVEQLDWVKKYFEKWIKKLGKLNNWLDPYLVIFYPAAKGKPDNYTLPKYVTPQNKAFDYIVKDGYITVGEIRKFFEDRIKKEINNKYWKYFNL